MSYKSRLPHIAAEIAPRMDALAAAAAELVVTAAQSRVPVNTGKLRDAIHIEHEGVAEYTVLAGDDGVFYGHIVEHGGAHTGARPFMTPAAESARAALPKLGARILRGL